MSSLRQAQYYRKLIRRSAANYHQSHHADVSLIAARGWVMAAAASDRLRTWVFTSISSELATVWLSISLPARTLGSCSESLDIALPRRRRLLLRASLITMHASGAEDPARRHACGV